MSDNNQALKDAGLKVTLPRLKILEVLQQPDCQHISAEDLYKAQVVTSNGTTISQGIKKVEATVGTTQKQTLEFKVTDGGQSPAGTYFLKINALNADNNWLNSSLV